MCIVSIISWCSVVLSSYWLLCQHLKMSTCVTAAVSEDEISPQAAMQGGGGGGGSDRRLWQYFKPKVGFFLVFYLLVRWGFWCDCRDAAPPRAPPPPPPTAAYRGPLLKFISNKDVWGGGYALTSEDGETNCAIYWGYVVKLSELSVQGCTHNIWSRPDCGKSKFSFVLD